MDLQKLIKPLLVAAGFVAVLLLLGVPRSYLVLPLLIVACPLMMFFMMRGMNHDNAAGQHRQDESVPPTHEHR